MVHPSSSTEAPRCTRIVVSAVDTTSVSSTTISDAAEARARTHRRTGAEAPGMLAVVMSPPVSPFGHCWLRHQRRPERNGRFVSGPDGVLTCDGERTSRCEDAMVNSSALARARVGDEQAFRELTDPYRRELLLHCYQILGSVQDAEDMLQETLLAAWRGLAGFEGRASLRSWLHKIAANGCLNALRDRGRRPREVPLMAGPPEPTRQADPVWVEPYPDVLLDGLPDLAPGPEARYELRESAELAFITGLQHLPPRQRAVLMLRDVLGFRAAEVAD